MRVSVTAVVEFKRGKGDRQMLRELLDKIPEDAAISVMSTGRITAVWGEER